MDQTKMISPFKKRHKAMAAISEKKVIEVKYLTLDEYLTFLEKIKEYSVMYWALALTQQAQVLRISEAAAMKWSNLDLTNRTYRISEHVAWARVKGRKSYLIGGTKTNRSGQVFYSPLRQITIDALKELEPHKSGDLIFHDNGEVLSYRKIQYAYDNAFIKAGLSQRSTHVLRHTGATLFLEETGDTLALQQLGNWNDQKMALHYGKILSSRARDAIDKAENRPTLRLIHAEKKAEVI
jgi:integrase